MSKPKVSVIIPTRNRAEVLRLALESLGRQTLSQELFEVIVVDNGSTDHTQAVCDELEGLFQSFRCEFAERPGLHEGRHAGLRAACGEILVYADDDVEAFDSWLAAVLEAFEDPLVGLVGGKNLPKWERPPPHWLWEMWFAERVTWGRRLGSLSILDFGDEIVEIDPYYVYGCNFSVRKDVVLQAGGFHPDGMPPDLIAYRGDGESYISGFVQSSGLKTLYHPHASVFHLVPANRMNQDYFQKRAFNQGVSDSFASVRERGSPLPPKSETFLMRVRRKMLDHLLRRDVGRVEDELRKGELRRAIERSYAAGFEFHQESCRRDRELLDWVLKENFL